MKSKEFSLKIEQVRREKRISYMEAVLEFCKEKDIDPGQVNGLISKSLKEKIKAEAIDLRLLKGSSSAPQGKLPI
jgi:hypothetical protein